MAVMRRVLVYDHMLVPKGELAPADVLALRRVEEINGEDSLTISTTAHLGKGDRVLLRDDTLTWHEYIVDAPDELHEQGAPIGTYECESSLMELQADYVTQASPGENGDVAAETALAMALDGSSWGVGDVTVTTRGAAEFTNMSAWDCVKKVVEVWGGELRADVQVSLTGVVSRRLSLVARRGSDETGRRFDYGRDLSSVRRKVAAGMVPTALYAWGKELDSEGDGPRQLTGIASVNGGVPYVVAPDDVVRAFARPDGSGGYRQNFATYQNSDQDDPSALLAEAREAVKTTCAPTVTYEATVAQFAEAGTDLLGVGLGDTVQVVDHGFLEDGLRVEARVVGIEHDDLARTQSKVTLGSFGDSLSSYLNSLDSAAQRLDAMIPSLDDPLNLTGQYIERLINRLNQAINATGGYAYIRQGEGIKVYDKAEDQEPTKVIELKGGSLRIADSRKSDGTWDWKTVMTASDGLVASAVTAAHIVSGWIGSPSGNYWNLDTGEMRLASTTTVGGKTVEEIAKESVPDLTQDSVFNALTNNGQTQGIYLQNGLLYLNGTYIRSGRIDADLITTGTLSDKAGKFVLDLDSGTLAIGGGSTIAGESASDLADLLTYFRFTSDGLLIQKSSGSYKTLYTDNGFQINTSDDIPCVSFGMGSLTGGYGTFIQGNNNEVLQLRSDAVSYCVVNFTRDSVDVNAASSSGLTRSGANTLTGAYHAWYNLYYNTSGTTGSVSLRLGVNSFNVLCFVCRDSDGNSFGVMSAAGSGNVELSASYTSDVGTYIDSKTVSVSGTSVTAASGRGGRGYTAKNNVASSALNTGLVSIVAVYGLAN